MKDNHFSWFKLFGSLVLVYSAILVLLVSANASTRASGGRDISRLLVWSIGFVPIAFGLLFHQKWAAVIFAATCFSLSAWLIVGSIFKVDWPFAAINIILGLCFLVPSYITYSRWAELH